MYKANIWQFFSISSPCLGLQLYLFSALRDLMDIFLIIHLRISNAVITRQTNKLKTEHLVLKQLVD